MIPLIWIRGIIAAAIISMVTGGLYLGYSKVKSIGYNEASDKYELVIKEYNQRVLDKIDAIEQNSNTLVIEAKANSDNLSKGISTITKSIKNKPMVVVKEGVCTPSVTFSNSFGEINKRVNESIKGSQK